MARPQYSQQKRQKELAKQRKKLEKQQRKLDRKTGPQDEAGGGEAGEAPLETESGAGNE